VHACMVAACKQAVHKRQSSQPVRRPSFLQPITTSCERGSFLWRPLMPPVNNVACESACKTTCISRVSRSDQNVSTVHQDNIGCSCAWGVPGAHCQQHHWMRPSQEDISDCSQHTNVVAHRFVVSEQFNDTLFWFTLHNLAHPDRMQRQKHRFHIICMLPFTSSGDVTV